MNQPILLKDQPRYECFVDAAKQFPAMNPSAMYAFVTLLHGYDELWRQITANFAKHGISQGRFMVMMILMEKEGDTCPTVQTPADLADTLRITRASVTGLLDSLEKDAFVRREPDPNDRRMTSIILTEKGQAFLNEFLPPHFKLIAQLMSGLNVNERETLVKLLNKLIDGVHQVESKV